MFEGRTSTKPARCSSASKGKIYSPGDYGDQFEIIGKADLPEVELRRSPGHFAEWVRAIKGGEPAMSNFPDYAGPLTETILLGNLAVWVAATGKGEKAGVGPQGIEGQETSAAWRRSSSPFIGPGYSL